MAKRKDGADIESPLLSMPQVSKALSGEMAELGAWGGRLGGKFVGGASAYAAEKGASAGARFGAKYLTKLDGDHRVLPIDRTEEALDRARAFFTRGVDERAGDDEGEPGAVLMVGVVGGGAAGMNPVVTQVVWYIHELRVTTFAREGLIKQHAARKALDRLEAMFGAA